MRMRTMRTTSREFKYAGGHDRPPTGSPSRLRSIDGCGSTGDAVQVRAQRQMRLAVVSPMCIMALKVKRPVSIGPFRIVKLSRAAGRTVNELTAHPTNLQTDCQRFPDARDGETTRRVYRELPPATGGTVTAGIVAAERQSETAGGTAGRRV